MRASAATLGMVTGAGSDGNAQGATAETSARRGFLAAPHPLAIAMWDFSWLERRWPGAGYENWDVALDELRLRGYDAVRIDPYPHLLAIDAGREWEILPCWNQQDWGAPALVRVQVQPALNDFIGKCAERGLKVGLSTWFREDRDNSRMRVRTPGDLGAIWARTLDSLGQAGHLDTVLYVDLCNEWPLDVWAPFLPKGFRRVSAEGARWMREAIAVVRTAFPAVPCTFSFTTEYDTWQTEDVSMHDFLELHCWMTHWSDFYAQVGYNYERFESKGYDNLVRNAERIYRERRDHWDNTLVRGIERLAQWSRASGRPLVTTECWAIVDYKDWPLLDWGWVKDLCVSGVTTAAATRCWSAIATSNFCGPQFRGMWRDVEWHQRLTRTIHAAQAPGSI